ncbi:hypothetical protein J6590_036224 [Homalodisca vitripennis]|nr:hypothetical protein J6590_036224 [Homalodisca vitripennis]
MFAVEILTFPPEKSASADLIVYAGECRVTGPGRDVTVGEQVTTLKSEFIHSVHRYFKLPTTRRLQKIPETLRVADWDACSQCSHDRRRPALHHTSIRMLLTPRSAVRGLPHCHMRFSWLSSNGAQGQSAFLAYFLNYRNLVSHNRFES